MKIVRSLNDPNIVEFLNLKEFNSKNKNLICAQSEKVVLKLLKSPYKVLKILSFKDFFIQNQFLLSQKSVHEQLFAGKDLLKKIIGHNHHQGVFALANRPMFRPLDCLGYKILILNGLTSPENVGALSRTAAAFNINSLIIDNKTVDPYLKRCIRVSMGNIFQLKIHFTDNLPETLLKLKNDNYKVVGTANEKSSKKIEDYPFPKKVALIIGSEGHGLDNDIKTLCDKTLKIEIEPHVMHLNAASAGAIFLYEMSKSL